MSSCPLTARQLEIVHLAACGLVNKEIAPLFGLKEQTIKNHISYILDRMGLDNRVSMVVVALLEGWLDQERLKDFYRGRNGESNS